LPLLTVFQALPVKAQLLIAEIGVNIDRFPSAAHLCKWARVCPGNYESAGKRYSGNTGQANRWLRSALVQAANAAIKCKQSYLAVVYRRLAARRGHKRQFWQLLTAS